MLNTGLLTVQCPTVPCFIPQTYFFLKNLLVKFTWPTAYVLIPSEDLPLVVQNLKKDGSALWPWCFEVEPES